MNTEESKNTEEAAVDTATSEEGSAMYEVAFHINSAVGEDGVAAVVADIRGAFEKQGGTFDSDEAPQHVDLAYDIVQTVEGKNKTFSDAYFGWMRFTINAEKVGLVKEELDGHASVLRHIILRLTKDEIAHPFKGFVGMKQKAEPTAPQKPAPTITQKPDIKDEAEEEKKEVSEEELDKAIEDIGAAEQVK